MVCDMVPANRDVANELAPDTQIVDAVERYGPPMWMGW